jgi:hypothetical protein
MQNILRIGCLLILAITFSCEEKGFIVQCSDCVADEPFTTELQVTLEPDLFFDSLIQIWEGNLEDSILVGNYTANSSDFTQEVILNKQYTVTATYYVSNDKYVAVDSATPRVKYDKSQCDEPCYFVYDRKCNLRLKYTK